MDCPSCVARIEKAVSRIGGVQEVSANLVTETLTARLDPDADPAVVCAIESLGYKAARQTRAASATPLVHGRGPGCAHDQGRSDTRDTAFGHPMRSRAHDRGEEEDEEPGASWWLTGKAKLVWLLGSLVVAAWVGSRVFGAEAYWMFLATSLIAVVPFGRRAAALARAGSPFSIETLISVAVLGAVAIGAAEEAAVVVVLFAVGELLENVAAGKARAGIRALADLMPHTALVERNGAVAEIAADALQIGDVVQVRPADRVPSMASSSKAYRRWTRAL